ncbi:MFS transporter [Flavobacterium gilvum]|uniref:MFS transporter n=1 Tax=Flavobacterium gilvum TaxID=1492737 RepID=A0AAC9I1M3_9FLAO|nr:MFS transporter [Flavobacterium gilvum]AOW08105.1 MFS transporter [Flavobacterium gilvum]KFC58872.1 MFS transporter [Flavobacterium gilvum]
MIAKLTEKKSYPWIVVGLLWFVALLNYLDRQMLSTMKPSMMLDIPELAKAENFGLLMAIFLWIYALMSPVSGIIADRMNRKNMIVCSLFIWSGVTMAMGYATTFNQIYALRAIMGFSEAFYIPAALSLIADYHQGSTRSFAIGIHTTGIYLGQALGGFGATISKHFSWHFAFHSVGLIGIIYSILLIFFIKEKKAYVFDFSQKFSIGTEFRQMFNGLGILFGNISFWVLLFYFSAPSLPGWAAKNWLPTLFSEKLHMDMALAGPISTVSIAMSSFVGVLVGGFISDKWIIRNLKGRIYTSAIGLSLTIPALFLLGNCNSIEAIIAGGMLFGLGFGIFDTNNMPILCQFVSPRYRATGYGIMNFVGISAGAVITEFLGKAADKGGMEQIFVLLILVVIIAIVLQLVCLRPKTINMTEEITNSELVS